MKSLMRVGLSAALLCSSLISRFSAMLVIVRTLLLGPVGSRAAQAISPQPAWVDADVFIRNYRPIQALPFYFGLLLLSGFKGFFSSLPKPEADIEAVS